MRYCRVARSMMLVAFPLDWSVSVPTAYPSGRC
jgi:hypothetical protein